MFGHGTHTIQGVEIYNGKPILYAIGHSNFDQPGYEKSVDGLVARVVIQGKSIRRVSFVPVSRDANNDVYLLDPSEGEGAKLVQWVKERSSTPPALRIDGHEVVMFEKRRPHYELLVSDHEQARSTIIASRISNAIFHGLYG